MSYWAWIDVRTTINALIVIAATLAVAIAILLYAVRPVGTKRSASGRTPVLPPGPRGVAVLGNLLDVATQRDPEHKFVSSSTAPSWNKY